MRVVVTIQHAGHVHFFKHAIAALEADGHDVFVFARENAMSTALLDRCGIEYELLAGESDSLVSLARAQCVYEARLLGRAREIQPDVMTAVGGVAVSPRRLARRRAERRFLRHRTRLDHPEPLLPFADVICTPACFEADLGDNHHRYPGYHELAYLHPTGSRRTRTCARPSASRRTTGSWSSVSATGASHDVGEGGFDDHRSVVERLEAAGATVRITAEGDLDDDLREYELSVQPERLHDLLAASDLYVGEGATTAAECAVLGTPAVYVNSLPLGYLTELEEAYGLVHAFTDDDRHVRAVNRATAILQEDGDGETWRRRRERLLADKCDVTDVVLDRRSVPRLQSNHEGITADDDAAIVLREPGDRARTTGGRLHDARHSRQPSPGIAAKRRRLPAVRARCPRPLARRI